MLYVFHGSDISAAVRKANTLADSLRAKKPDASFVRIEAAEWNPAVVTEHAGGQGLFSNKYIVLLDRVLAEAILSPIPTNAVFLRRILGHESFRAGQYDTTFVDQLSRK